MSHAIQTPLLPERQPAGRFHALKSQAWKHGKFHLAHIAAKAMIFLMLFPFLGCSAYQHARFKDGNRLRALAIGPMLGGIIIQRPASQEQKALAVSLGRHAYKNNLQFRQKYTKARKETRVRYIAVKVPKDKSSPNSKAGFMLYDPSRGSLNSNTVYVSNSRASNGSVADIDGKRAIIYSNSSPTQ